MPDPVGRHLEHVFEEGDAPADERGNIPGAMRKVLEVAVPGEGHEHIRQDQQPDGGQNRTHGFCPPAPEPPRSEKRNILILTVFPAV